MGERIGWLDTARAIGIAAVVVGHVTRDHAVWTAAFHFHMPLFFMLSGMMFRPAAIVTVAHDRARALLVPYAAWLAIVATLDGGIAAISTYSPSLPWDRPLVAVARALLGGTFLVGAFGVFWFVTCLYLVQLLAAAILRRSNRQIVGAALLALVAAHLIGHWLSPLGVISLPAGLFFFLAGALYHRHAAADRVPIVLAVAAAALALLSRPLDMKIADVGTPVVSMLAALALCHLVILAARRLPTIRWVAIVGQASLVVMYLHLILLHGLRDAVPDGAILVLGILLPSLLWMLLRRFRVTRALLLGERLDRREPGGDVQGGLLRAPFQHQQP